ncbi:hydroxycarboxylic acid receptor 2 [Trichomycterus rosablanca]|uniref:hydroxycarboxylic acid receptor 2 n=1 Tax=Trichomycterus rosablanca TaxID=2290929 RepID=UPI002F353BF7
MNNTSTCMEAQSLVASALTPMLILDFILGLPGNILALWIFACKAPWKTSTICFLNLVLADIMLLIGLPFQIDSLVRGGWIFGDSFCRINLFMLSVNQSASIFFITALVVDRFYRIVHPLHQICRMSTQHTVMVACGVWVVVVAFRIPLLVTRIFRTSGNSFLCQTIDLWTESGTGMRVHNIIYITEFVLAFVLVVFFSVRILYHIQGNKRLKEHRRVKRTIYLLLVVVIMFTFCFLPGYITGLVAFFLRDVSSCSPYVSVGQMFSLSLGLAYLNSALDPILYTFSSARFRDTLKGVSNSTGVTNFKLSVKESRKPRRP